jgi:hypothetical protein
MVCDPYLVLRFPKLGLRKHISPARTRKYGGSGRRIAPGFSSLDDRCFRPIADIQRIIDQRALA